MQRYEITATVIETRTHGPMLCLGPVRASYPPQGGNLDLIGFDWASVPDREAAYGTTWGSAHFVGTLDGTTFTLTESPGPARDALDPDYVPSDGGGRQISRAELGAVQEEVFDADARAAFEPVMGWRDPHRGVMVVSVAVAEDAARAYAEQRWGDLVELRGLLRPVD